VEGVAFRFRDKNNETAAKIRKIVATKAGDRASRGEEADCFDRFRQSSPVALNVGDVF